MQTIRAILILIATVVFIPLTNAQLNKANRLYRYYCYAEAIPWFIKAADKEKDPKLRAKAISRLADCYRFTNNTGLACVWYAKAVQLENIDPVNYLYYGQALQSKSDYANAKEAFLKYSLLAPGDPRGSLLAASCDLSKKWENIAPEFEIRNMAMLSSKWSDFGPAYYKNGLIFASDRKKNFLENTTYGWTNNNYLDMYFAEQDYPANPFADMKKVNSFSKTFNKIYHDGPASFSADYSTIYLTRSYNDKTEEKDQIKNHLLKIFYAKTNGKNWMTEKPFFLNSEDYSVAHPSLGADGRTIYFSSDMPGGFGVSDIWCCHWENDKWSAPENLGKEVNTFGNEAFPFILNDSTLYFASSGLPGYGGLDVFVAKKKNGRWQMPRNLQKPVNSSYDDFSFILNATDANGFFSSNRPGGSGSDDIYASKRLRVIPDVKPVVIPKVLAYFVSGYVNDKNSLEPIAGAKVYLLNQATGIVKVLISDNNGYFESHVDKDGIYISKVTKQSYIPDCVSLLTIETDSIRRKKASANLQLDKIELHKEYKLENIYYDFNKFNIRNDAKPEIDKLVQLMKDNQIYIEIESHTDSRGNALYNRDLSQKRAESVVSYMVQEGIESLRIKAMGYGESKLANFCSDGVTCSAAEHQENRRTLFKVVKFIPPVDSANIDRYRFNAGDEVPLDKFDKKFFNSCPQYKLKAVPANLQAKVTKFADPSKTTQVTVQQKAAPPIATAAPKVIVEKTANNRIWTSQTPNTNAIGYRVQLYALGRFIPLDAAEFALLRDVKYSQEVGLYKYTAGNFTTSDEARAYRDLLVGMGFEKAFVVAFKNDKHIDMPQIE